MNQSCVNCNSSNLDSLGTDAWHCLDCKYSFNLKSLTKCSNCKDPHLGKFKERMELVFVSDYDGHLSHDNELCEVICAHILDNELNYMVMFSDGHKDDISPNELYDPNNYTPVTKYFKTVYKYKCVKCGAKSEHTNKNVKDCYQCRLNNY